MKYYVMYVERCSPSVKSFRTRLGATKFVDKFLKKNVHNTDDNWVDFIWKGEVVETVEAYWFNKLDTKRR